MEESTMKKIRIGSGAGYAGDRLEPAIELMKKGNLDYIVFECLAERTIAIAQQQKLKDPAKGYNHLLEYRMEKVVPLCKEKQIKVITNMGAANPIAAAKAIKAIALEQNISGLKIAVVLGDDILSQIDQYTNIDIIETGEKLETLKEHIVSANAYIGAKGIVEALEKDADIVITGRVADPSLVLAPLIFEFGWDWNNFDMLGKGTLAGHLLECGAQVSGGYYADPGCKDVPDLWDVGFPIAEIDENGTLTIEKLADAGGIVNTKTVKEQLLYELHDPSNYLTPDVTADFSNVFIEEVETNKVLATGASGKERNGFYKTSIGYKDCYIAKGEISYGGSGAFARAQLAGDIIKKRLAYTKVPIQELRIDYLGVNSLYKDEISNKIHNHKHDFTEVRLRIAARTLQKNDAAAVCNEVEALYTNGPAGGGGANVRVKEVISIASILVPSENIHIQTIIEEV